MSKHCNCWSVGLDSNYAATEKDKPILLDMKDYFPRLENHTYVGIDYCISHVIAHLWKNNIETLNSCCGHNGNYSERPSIVFNANLSESKAENIRKLISKVDDRDFELLAWKLCNF